MCKLGNVLSLLFLTVIVNPNPSLAATDPACPLSATLPASDVLIGYIGNARRTDWGEGPVRLGSFRVFGIVRNGTLVTSDGASIREGMNYWNVLESSRVTALKQVSSHLDRLGVDHCVFHAEPKENLPQWTLLADRPLPEVFDNPDLSETAYFAKHHDICIDVGDYDPSRKKPACRRPRLLAVSDLNEDGENEYWATEPYTWDTGITVWKRTETGLTPIQKVCSGCSD